MQLTLLSLTVFEQLHTLERSAAGNELVRELGLVVVATTAVDLLMGITAFI